MNHVPTNRPQRRGSIHRTLPNATSHRARHFDARVALDLIADLHVVVVLHADTALSARSHFVDVILEATQRFQTAFEDDHVVAARESGCCAARNLR